METKLIRQKLISDFGKILEDDTKLNVLEGVFDAINNEENKSLVSEEHYLKVEESRAIYLSDKTTGVSWDDFEKQLNAKYGF